jgi:hypothetical protein
MTDPLIPQPAAADPWGHEPGEDTGHLLDAWGRVPHQAEPLAHLIGTPQPIKRPRLVDPKVAYATLAVVAIAVAAVVAISLGAFG